MMDLSRRGFLKAVAAVTAGALIVPSVRLILPNESLLNGEQWVATVRELTAYEIISDEILLRHDILGPGKQFSCTQRLLPSQTELSIARRMACSLLEGRMRMEGWTVHDLKPLAIPARWSEPDWLRSLPA